MKKVFGAIATVVSIAIGVVCSKLIYDVIQDKKKREQDDLEFLDDLEEDLSDVSFAPSDVKSKTDKEHIEPSGNKAGSKTDKTSKSVEETKDTKETTDISKDLGTLTCADVIECTARVLSVSVDDILSKSRKLDVAAARRIAIYICAHDLGISNSVISEQFGGVASSSVSNAKRNVSMKLEEDDELAADIEDITEELRALERSKAR